MRTLKFNVDGQHIEKDPKCNFDGLVPGTEGYVQAEFSFSPEWKGMVKVAGFITRFQEHNPQILSDGNTCMIPASALEHKRFKIYIVGKNDTVKLTTNKVSVCQNGGN